jgi:hypothetical protein
VRFFPNKLTFQLSASHAAVVTSPILLPADSNTIGYTFSEGGVGSDGRTTFVATGITSNFLVEDRERTHLARTVF